MRDAEAAERCLSSSLAHTIFCGHTHIPAVYYALPGKRPVHFRPHDEYPGAVVAAAPACRRRRLGRQPRDAIGSLLRPGGYRTATVTMITARPMIATDGRQDRRLRPACVARHAPENWPLRPKPWN